MRETGPVSKQLDNLEKSNPYIGLARTILGQLKADMAFIGLAQGVRSRDLPDGTSIQVSSRFGQDAIAITAPGAVAPEVTTFGESFKTPEPPAIKEEQLIDEAVFTGVRVVGYGNVPNSGATFPLLWKGPQTVQNLGYLPGGFTGRAAAISDDGTAVVGWCNVAVGDFAEDAAWRWTVQGGMQNLGKLNPVSPGMFATSVSLDGDTVVGHGRGVDGVTTCWVWSEANGLLALPHLGLGATGARISPGGQYIVASISTPSSGGSNTDGGVWVRQTNGSYTGPTLIPRPGTSSGLSGIAPTGSYEDVSVPTDVNDAGIVTGHTTHQDLIPFYVTNTFWDQGDGVPTPFVSGVEGTRGLEYQVAQPSTATVFKYTVATALYETIDGAVGGTAAAANDRFTIIGNERHQELAARTDFFNRPPPPAPIFRASFYNWYGGAAPAVSFGWYWSALRGKQLLGPGTLANDITENAYAICGARQSGDGFLPVVWVNKAGAPADLLLPPEASGGGQATSIASFSAKVSTEGRLG